MVAHTAHNGTLNQIPFCFQHFNISSLQLMMAGIPVSTTTLNMSFKEMMVVGITVITLAEFDNIIEVDHYREISLDDQC